MFRVTLIIFAKFPQAGRSKTRLGKSIGMARAASLFRFMTQKTINTACAVRARNPNMRIVLAVDPPKTLGARCPYWNVDVERIAQRGDSLGDRMKNAMRDVPNGPTIIIGADAPQITSLHILDAVNALKGNDAVFGPAYDGGYWLAGFAGRKGAPDLFEKVRWSSSTTLSDTINSMPSQFTVAKLEVLRDIDEKEDLDQLEWNELSLSARHRAQRVVVE